MPEDAINPNGGYTYRPVLLTVLCVLTFIGSITGIIVNTMGYVNADEEVANISSGKSKTQLRNLFSSNKEHAPEHISNLNVENYQKYSIGCIAAYILCLVGTVLIFKLKRTGFYSFTLGAFFNLITHFLLFGDNFGGMGISILASLLLFVFVILYGMNLKYMDEG